MKNERRLKALEKSVTKDSGSFVALMHAVESGLLTVQDFPKLTDQQLWWIATGKQGVIPMDDVAYEILRRVLSDLS